MAEAATGLALTYLGGFGASHPLAKKIGAWPSVLAVGAVSAAASYPRVRYRRGGLTDTPAADHSSIDRHTD